MYGDPRPLSSSATHQGLTVKPYIPETTESSQSLASAAPGEQQEQPARKKAKSGPGWTYAEHEPENPGWFEPSLADLAQEQGRRTRSSRTSIQSPSTSVPVDPPSSRSASATKPKPSKKPQQKVEACLHILDYKPSEAKNKGMDTDMGTGGHSSKRLRGDSAASHAHQSGLHTNRVDASSGQGQSAVEQEAAIAQGQPPAKRPRTDSESSPGTSNATGIKLRVTPRPPPQATAAVSQPAPQATTAGSSTRKALPNFSKPQESSLSAVPAQSGGSDTQIGQVSSTNAPPPSTSAKTAAKVGKTGSEASLNKPSAPSQAQSATKSAPSRSNTPNRALGQAARPPNQQQPAKKSSETLNDLLGRKTAAPSKPIPSSDTRPGTPRGSAAGGPSSVKISAVEEVSKTSADAQSKKEETTTEAPPAEPAQSQDGDSQESSQGKDSNKRKRDNKAEALFGQKIKKGNNPLASLKMTKSGSNTQPVPEAGPSQPQPVLLHQFNQNKRQAEEAAAAQEKQRRDAEQEAAIRREEWQGYDTYEEFMAAKQAHEKDIQDRDKHYADVKPFDLLEQHRIFGELHNDYKLRIAHHNEWLKWQPMSSHFSEDYKKRWCESSTDEPEPELQEGDLIYDEPIWAVRPGQWGALFRNHINVQWYDPREEEIGLLETEEATRAQSQAKSRAHRDEFLSDSREPVLNYDEEAAMDVDTADEHLSSYLERPSDHHDVDSVVSNFAAHSVSYLCAVTASGSVRSCSPVSDVVDSTAPFAPLTDTPPLALDTFNPSEQSSRVSSLPQPDSHLVCNNCQQTGHLTSHCQQGPCVLCKGSHPPKDCNRIGPGLFIPCVYCKTRSGGHAHCRLDCPRAPGCHKCGSTTHAKAQCGRDGAVFSHSHHDLSTKGATTASTSPATDWGAPEKYTSTAADSWGEPSRPSPMPPEAICRNCHRHGHETTDCPKTESRIGPHSVDYPDKSGSRYNDRPASLYQPEDDRKAYGGPQRLGSDNHGAVAAASLAEFSGFAQRFDPGLHAHGPDWHTVKRENVSADWGEPQTSPLGQRLTITSSASDQGRMSPVHQQRICQNCFGFGHRTFDCQKLDCILCEERHRIRDCPYRDKDLFLEPCKFCVNDRWGRHCRADCERCPPCRRCGSTTHREKFCRRQSIASSKAWPPGMESALCNYCQEKDLEQFRHARIDCSRAPLCKVCKNPGHQWMFCAINAACSWCGKTGHHGVDCLSKEGSRPNIQNEASSSGPPAVCKFCRGRQGVDPHHPRELCRRAPKCQHCGERAHHPNDCPSISFRPPTSDGRSEEPQRGPSRFLRTDQSTTQCEKCGSFSHSAEHCADSSFCSDCQKPGHLRSDCRSARGSTCSLCQGPSHADRPCVSSYEQMPTVGRLRESREAGRGPAVQDAYRAAPLSQRPAPPRRYQSPPRRHDANRSARLYDTSHHASHAPVQPLATATRPRGPANSDSLDLEY